MRFKESRLSQDACGSHHCRVEALEVTYLQHCFAATRCFDDSIGFVERARDRLFDEHRYTSIQQLASDGLMRFGWNCQTDRIYFADDFTIGSDERRAVVFSH